MHDRAGKGYGSIPGLKWITNFFACMFTKTYYNANLFVSSNQTHGPYKLGRGTDDG